MAQGTVVGWYIGSHQKGFVFANIRLCEFSIPVYFNLMISKIAFRHFPDGIKNKRFHAFNNLQTVLNGELSLMNQLFRSNGRKLKTKSGIILSPSSGRVLQLRPISISFELPFRETYRV